MIEITKEVLTPQTDARTELAALPPLIVWHYTTGVVLPRILADGEIKQAVAGIEPNEKPAVWFSSHPVWEPTATKGVSDDNGIRRWATREEMLAVGLVRIGVMQETAPHNWMAYKRLSGVSDRMAGAMRITGYDKGARISQWFVSFDPVPREKWVSIEVWNGSEWEPYLRWRGRTTCWSLLAGLSGHICGGSTAHIVCETLHLLTLVKGQAHTARPDC